MAGFEYASCDGNYTWLGETDTSGNLVFKPSSNIATGQEPDRLLFLRPDGMYVGCGKLGQSGPVYGDRSPAISTESWARLKLTYDPRLLAAAAAKK